MNKMKKWCGVLIAAVLFGSPIAICCQQFALHDGDRVLFYGDSITAQRFYTRFAEDFVLTRYPGLHITFINAGVPGDTVYGGYTGDQATRLKRDVFPQHPSVITIMLGMNDGYYVPFEQKYFDIYAKGYAELLSAMKSNLPGVRITLLTPTPYDEVTHGTEFAHYNESVGRNAAFVRGYAASSHLPMSDLNQAVANLATAGVRKNSSLAALLIPDRIHPAETAHWVMAAELAKTWGATPFVSRVSLDAAKGSVLQAEQSHVSALERKSTGLTWTQMDDALPLPLPLENEMMQFVLDISDLPAMDQQILQVSGLPEQRYSLKIDGKAIASFSREQLAKGINLALFPTPMENQAKDVDGLERERSELDEAVFLLTINDSKSAADPATIKSIDAKNASKLEEQRKACKPLSHRFELVAE
jgi:lysophospholipase L1-like esterase